MVTAHAGRYSARSVAASYKPPMLVTRVRLPACAKQASLRVSLATTHLRARTPDHLPKLTHVYHAHTYFHTLEHYVNSCGVTHVLGAPLAQWLERWSYEP